MIKFIFKLGLGAMAIMFAGVYFIRATESTGVQIESVESFKQNNLATVESADNVVRFVEAEVSNFQWEEFKGRMSNLFESFKGDVENNIQDVKESQQQVSDSLSTFNVEVEEFSNDIEELENQFDEAVSTQEDYQEKIDLLESKIEEVLDANKMKDKKRLRLVNAKKIAKLEKRLFRTKDPIKRERLRDLIRALSGEY